MRERLGVLARLERLPRLLPKLAITRHDAITGPLRIAPSRHVAPDVESLGLFEFA
ncbi:MAG: hypothetical protein ACO38P_06685 [Phycisphaerales bacterium]